MKRAAQWAAVLAPFALGLAVAALWASSPGGRAARAELAGARAWPLAGAVSLTALSIALRFVRWRFLARRAGEYVPARLDLCAYLASLAGRATPAYVGEVVRCFMLRRAGGVPVALSLPLLVAERALDAAVLAVLAAFIAPDLGWSALALAGAALAALAALVAWRVAAASPGRAAGSGEPAESAGPPAPAEHIALAVALSLAAWLPAAGTLVLSARALDLALPFADGLRAFCNATLGGALSLLPAGVGATGSVAIFELGRSGLSAGDAVAVTTLFRLTTTGFALCVGLLAMAVAVRAWLAAPRGGAHFDAIARDYAGYVDSPVWRVLIDRRVERMQPWLPAPGSPQGRAPLLDLGCGLGAYGAALAERGRAVVGVDAARSLLASGIARGAGLRPAQADVLRLPFADGSFAAVYAVGVLHHLNAAGEQARAVREVARVLAPGGVFVVHETNTQNPLFRLYMGYVFPILKSVDEGTERWIPPSSWSAAEGFALEHVEYFTFVPDFAPPALLPALEKLERRLESSRLAPFAVHYMAVLRRI